MPESQEPKGVPFFSVKSGDTHYARSEAQIQAYINSSDMGVNASRGQDFGWRLGADWVKAVKEYRRDDIKMAALQTRNEGRKVTDINILHAIYGEQLRKYYDRKEEEENPYEEDYRQEVSGKKKEEPALAPAATTVPEKTETEKPKETPETKTKNKKQ